MSDFEREPRPELFTSEEYTKSYDWDKSGRENSFHRVAVNPEVLTDFEDTTIQREVVARVLAYTINGMINHGASALGMDLDSMFGRVHASGHLTAAMDVGATILNDIAPRTDETTWHDWLKSEFPSAVATLYGDNSDAVKLAQQEMGTHLST